MKRFLLGMTVLSSVVGLGSVGVYYGHEKLAGAIPTQGDGDSPAPVDRTPAPLPLGQTSEAVAPSANPFGPRAATAEPAVAIERADAGQVDRYGRQAVAAEPVGIDRAADSADAAAGAPAGEERFERAAPRAERYNGEEEIAPQIVDPLDSAARNDARSRYAERTAADERLELDDKVASDIPDARLEPQPAAARGEPKPLVPVPAKGSLDRYGRSAVAEAQPIEPQAAAVAPAAADAVPTRRPAAGGFESRDALPAAEPATSNDEGTGRPGDARLSGSQAPTLTIEKAAPAEIQIGKPAKFGIKVRNAGSVPAHGVEVHDQIPQGTQLLSTTPQASRASSGELVWELGTMKPGDEQTALLELMPTAEGEIGSVATVHFRAEASVRTIATRPKLDMEVAGPDKVMKGEEVSLRIKVSNPGSGAATGVVLSETIPEGLSHPAGGALEFEIGTLKPGESRELQLGLMAAAAGVVINTLSASGDGNLRVEVQTPLEVIAPQLEVSMSGPKRRYLERNATHNISISNPGTAPAKDVELMAVLPRELKFVGANNGGQFDAATHAVYWSLEELPPQQTGTVTLTTLPLQAGDAKLTIKSRAKQNLADEREEVVSIEGLAAINFQLSDASDPIEVNAQTTYEVRVTNQGSKAASNVRLVALLPGEMKAVSAEGPARFRVEGQRVVFEPLKLLAPKADTTFKITAQALAAGDLRLQVQISTDEIREPITKEESTRVYGDE